MTGLSIMGLLPPGGSIVSGSIKLDGRELVGLSDAEMRKIRGNEIAMIFQDPLTSLDPTKTIGYQVAEPVRLHKGASKAAARARAIEVLGMVGLPRPTERLDDYPHQLSGGLRQRVMIAMALSCEPKLLIADEPTTALDVTIQAQILALLHDLKDRLGMAMLLITHDMGVIAGHADRVQVMYAGRMVEVTKTPNLFAHMRHPYTRALLASIPRLSQDNKRRLLTIGGLPPDLAQPAARLPVRAEVQPGHRQVPQRRAAAGRGDRRSTCSRAGIRSTGPPCGRAARPRARWRSPPARPGRTAKRAQRRAGGPAARGARSGQGVPGHRRGDLAAQGRRRARGVQRLVHRDRGRNVRPGGRVGLRQDHHRAGRRGARAARTRAPCCWTARASSPSAPVSCAGSGVTCS